MVPMINNVKTRLLVFNVFLFLLLLILSVSFPSKEMAPAFGGEGVTERIPLRTISLFDIVWSRPNLVKEVFKIGFPLVEHLEMEARDAGDIPLPYRLLGLFLGFSPSGPEDVALSFLAGYKDGRQHAALTSSKGSLEQDWGISPVLFRIEDGTPIFSVNFDGAGSPAVAIYHTHATESFLPEVKKNSPGDAFTEDLSKTVVKCGEYLLGELEARYKIPCLQSKTVHDAEGRVGAYYRSQLTVESIKEKYPGCHYFLDLHRDSQRAGITKVTIKGKGYARLLLVVGTNNPGWVANYSLAREVVSLLEDRYPGVTRGIMYQSQIYNQDISPNALLVEVGGVDNTLVECKNSMEALAWALASVILPSPPDTP